MPEHQEIEWKESWRDEYLKWLCGYANARGGTLFIGKDDNGNVVGVPDSKKLLEDLPNKITNTMGNAIDILSFLRYVQNVTVGIVNRFLKEISTEIYHSNTQYSINKLLQLPEPFVL